MGIKANRGFKDSNAWGRSFRTIGTRRADQASPPLSAPMDWESEGASECTVRIHRSLRDMLKAQIKQSNEYTTLKIKEVDAINSTVFAWISQNRANHILNAQQAKLVFKSDWKFDQSRAILGGYHKYIEKSETRRKIPGDFDKTYILTLKFSRTLKRSSAFRRDLLIVASLLHSYQITPFP